PRRASPGIDASLNRSARVENAYPGRACRRDIESSVRASRNICRQREAACALLVRSVRLIKVDIRIDIYRGGDFTSPGEVDYRNTIAQEMAPELWLKSNLIERFGVGHVEPVRGRVEYGISDVSADPAHFIADGWVG